MGCYGFSEFGVADMDDQNSCFLELSLQMVSIFLIPIIKNSIELLVPLIRHSLAQKKLHHLLDTQNVSGRTHPNLKLLKMVRESPICR